MFVMQLDPSQMADGPWRFSDNGDGAAAGGNTEHAVAKSYNALMGSVAMFGILQPIIVRTNPEGFPDYQVIDGHGRRDVATKLELPTVPAVVMEADDTRAAMMYVTANLTRLDLDHVKISQILGQLAKVMSPKTVIGLLPWPDHNTESYIELANHDWQAFVAKGAGQYDQQGFFDTPETEEGNGIDLNGDGSAKS